MLHILTHKCYRQLLFNILCFGVDTSSYKFVSSNQWEIIKKIYVFEGTNHIKIISWEGWTRLFRSSVNVSINFNGSYMAIWLHLNPWGWFNIKMSSYQYRKSHCGDKTILRPSYLHYGISYTGKMTSLYWISPQDVDNGCHCICYMYPNSLRKNEHLFRSVEYLCVFQVGTDID